MLNGNQKVHEQIIDARGGCKGIAALVVGNAFEFYDFMLYAMFAPVIARLFFPASDPQNSLLLALAGYGLGFLARPAGAALIGHVADRHGRKPALLLSLGLMGVGTLLLAATPSHATLGVAAPVLVVIARLLQGLSAGGEIGAASALMMEQGPARRRGEMLGWQIASQGVAALAATGVATLMHLTLPSAELEAWGWRIPFVAGLLIVPVGLILRQGLQEPAIRPLPVMPLEILLRQHGRTLLLAILVIAGGTVQMQLMTQYMPTYLQSRLQYPPAFSYLVSALVGLVLLAAPVAGRLGDRLRRRRNLLYLGYALNLMLAVPAFVALTAGTGDGMLWSLLPIVAMTLVYCLSAGTGLVVMLEGFPPALRATALGVSYSVGVAVFGGTTPVAVAWLSGHEGGALAPGLYLMGAVVVSLVALRFYPEAASAEPDALADAT